MAGVEIMHFDLFKVVGRPPKASKTGSEQGVRVANLVWELIIGIETVRDRRKPKYAINRTMLDKNFHKQLILRMYWQRKAMKHL